MYQLYVYISFEICSCEKIIPTDAECCKSKILLVKLILLSFAHKNQLQIINQNIFIFL